MYGNFSRWIGRRRRKKEERFAYRIWKTSFGITRCIHDMILTVCMCRKLPLPSSSSKWSSSSAYVPSNATESGKNVIKSNPKNSIQTKDCNAINRRIQCKQNFFFFFYSLLPHKMWMERHNNWSLRSHYHAPSLFLYCSSTIIIIITLVKRTVLSISCYAVMYYIVRFQCICICIRIVDMK